jgi:glycosyltransferase involved in cell wall biosynthesis
MRRNIGIYNLHMQAMGGGEKLTLALAEHLSLKHNVSLFCAEPLDVASLEQYFGVDLSRVKVNALEKMGPFSKFAGKVRGDSGSALSQQHYQQLRKLDLDIFINNSYGSGLMCPAARGILMCMFPHTTPPIRSEALDSYSTIVAISQYSADWIQQRWKRHSEIIYPPCDDMGSPAVKEKIILHVGRFIADSNADERHHKGQRLLLDVFTRLKDLQQDGWSLHFSGSLGGDKRSREFADALVQAAKDLPVFFHFNSPRETIRELYRNAAIYWHATGYGFDPNTYPGKQEHFGITTVEAMSAAAVPVVYSTGGQRETVTDGVDGLWWHDLDELTGQTRRLANDSDLRCKLGQQAVCSSERFNRHVFATATDNLIANLVANQD